MADFDFDIEFDLSDVKSSLDEGQGFLQQSLYRIVKTAGDEGLAEARRLRRYRNRTHNLTDIAHVRPIPLTGREAAVEIVWPVHYAKIVDEGGPNRRAFGFAGDAYLKAERVLPREVDDVVVELEELINRR